MNLKIENILVGLGGVIIALFALTEVIKYVIGLIYLLFVTDVLLPLLEQYKVLYQFLELTCHLGIAVVIVLAVISFVISLYGLKLYNAGLKLSKETAGNLLIKVLIIMIISLILGSFTIFIASSVAFLGALIALVKK